MYVCVETAVYTSLPFPFAANKQEFLFSISAFSVYMCTEMSAYIYTENGSNRKTATSGCLLKWKMVTTNFRLFAVNGNGICKFLFLGQQAINGKRRLLFQQSCPSMDLHSNLTARLQLQMFPT